MSANSIIRSVVDKSLSKFSANKFTPTTPQRMAKSAFWSHFFGTGDTPPDIIEPATAARYSGYNDVLEWWAIDGFSEWFTNSEEFRQRVEYVSNLALDVLQQVLQDDSARPGERLQAAKLSLEIASKFPKSSPKEQFADQKIGEMDRTQLEEFINKKMRNLRLPQES